MRGREQSCTKSEQIESRSTTENDNNAGMRCALAAEGYEGRKNVGGRWGKKGVYTCNQRISEFHAHEDNSKR